MNPLPMVSVIIPTYNRRDALSRELDSIIQQDYPKEKLEVIVIEDCCSDGTYEFISKRFPLIKIIRNKCEKGLAGSRNIGIISSKGDFILVIDDDNILDRFAISELVSGMLKDDEIGIAGPAMYYYRDPNRVWCMGIKRNYVTSITKFIYRDHQINDDMVKTAIESEDFPNAFMIKRKLIDKIGLFDEKTFVIHYDEADFGRRCKQAGLKVICVPSSKVWHDIPLPEEVDDKARLFHCQNEMRAFYAGRNRIAFHRKYSSKSQYFIFISIFNWLIMIYYIKVILKGSKKPLMEKFRIANAYVKGVTAGILGH